MNLQNPCSNPFDFRLPALESSVHLSVLVQAKLSLELWKRARKNREWQFPNAAKHQSQYISTFSTHL